MLLESDMGRLSKTTAPGRPSFKVHYKKLVDEYSDVLKFVPSLPDYLSYCCHQCGHTQKLQAEELNSIVGNAFRMAYAAQLQKQSALQDVIASHQTHIHNTDKVLWAKELSNALKKGTSPVSNNNSNSQTQQAEMDVQLNNSETSLLRQTPPSSIPGLLPAHKYNVLASPEKSQSQQSTPCSDESNSPTEMNSYKKMAEKPPLIKRLAMGFTHHNHHNNVGDEDSVPLVNNDGSLNHGIGSNPSSPSSRPISGGYVNETVNLEHSNNMRIECIRNDVSDVKQLLQSDKRILLPTTADDLMKNKRISQISSSSSSSCPANGNLADSLLGFTPPPLPERTDSLNNKEQEELRLAPWFQAGIPREIALEILGQEPVGAFMVRESTSKPGCFALSLRVPRNFQPTGIAHYLIIRSNKEYRIKGFTKEFSTLTSLIVHHSVMPELLPCPLSLSRYNPSFVRSESKRDFAEVDLDPDYNTLADFRKMMADLNV